MVHSKLAIRLNFRLLSYAQYAMHILLLTHVPPAGNPISDINFFWYDLTVQPKFWALTLSFSYSGDPHIYEIWVLSYKLDIEVKVGEVLNTRIE